MKRNLNEVVLAWAFLAINDKLPNDLITVVGDFVLGKVKTLSGLKYDSRALVATSLGLAITLNEAGFEAHGLGVLKEALNLWNKKTDVVFFCKIAEYCFRWDNAFDMILAEYVEDNTAKDTLRRVRFYRTTVTDALSGAACAVALVIGYYIGTIII